MKIKARDAAKILGVTYNTLVRYIETKQIKGIKEGRKWYLSSAEMKRVQENGIDKSVYIEALQVLKAKKAKEKLKKAKAKRQAELMKQEKQAKISEHPKIPDISLLTKDKYTVKEVREFLGRGEDFMQRRIKKGEIKVINLGRQVVLREELIKFVEANYPTPDPIQELGDFESPAIDEKFSNCEFIDVDAKMSPEERAEDERQVAADQEAYEEALKQGFDSKNPDEWYRKQWEKDEAERRATPYISEYKLSFCVSEHDYKLLHLVAECRKECIEKLLYYDIVQPFITYILYPKRPQKFKFYTSGQFPSRESLIKVEIDSRFNKLAKYEGIPLKLYLERVLAEHIREYSALVEEG